MVDICNFEIEFVFRKLIHNEKLKLSKSICAMKKNLQNNEFITITETEKGMITVYVTTTITYNNEVFQELLLNCIRTA